MNLTNFFFNSHCQSVSSTSGVRHFLYVKCYVLSDQTNKARKLTSFFKLDVMKSSSLGLPIFSINGQFFGNFRLTYTKKNVHTHETFVPFFCNVYTKHIRYICEPEIYAEFRSNIRSLPYFIR